jgi:hypothetical protein
MIMDSISNASRPDVVLVESTPRPTPKPTRVAFADVLSAGASGVVQGAEVAMSKIPGSPVTAAAVRGSPNATPMLVSNGSPVSTTPEGPMALSGAPSLSFGNGASTGLSGLGAPTTGTGVSLGGISLGGASSTDPSSGIEGAMQQSASLNLYYLQLQQQEDAQNRVFTAQSNILKTEHDSAKNAIGNIHS